jgi:hypothetical protein
MLRKMIVCNKFLEQWKYDYSIIINKIRGLGTASNAVNLRNFYHGCTRISTDKMQGERNFTFSLSILSKLLCVITIRVHQCLSVASLIFFTKLTALDDCPQTPVKLINYYFLSMVSY